MAEYAYTNIPEMEGKEAEKGLKYKYYPTPSTGEAKPEVPAPPTGIEDFVSPDYSHRDTFEKVVFEDIGGNPFEMDPMDAVNASDKELPALFSHIFAGRVLWQDRHLMNSKEREYWNTVVKQFRSDKFNEADAKRKTLLNKYNFRMNQFDNSAREYNANLTRYRTQLKEWEKTYGETAEYKAIQRAKADKAEAATELKRKKAEELRAEERIKRKEKRTAARKIKAGASREDMIAVMNFENKIIEDIKKGNIKTKAEGQIPSRYLKQINRLRRKAGLPRLKEEVVQAGKRREFLGIDWLAKDVEKIVKYIENIDEPTGEKEIVETRSYKGRKIVKYSDGTIAWMD